MKKLEDCSNDAGMESEEYETQYFSFGRKVLKSSLAIMVEAKLQSQVDSARRYLSSLDLTQQLKVTLDHKCANLLKFIIDKSRIPLQAIYSDLDKYLCIPESVLLPQDEIFRNEAEEEEVQRLREEVHKWKHNMSTLDATQILMEKEMAECGQIKKHLIVKEQQLLTALSGLEAASFIDDLNADL